MSTLQEDVVSSLSKEYSRGVSRVAQRLRDLADRVEQVGQVRKNLKDLQPDHLNSVETVLHELTWGYANLSADNLVYIAREADLAIRAWKEKDE